MKKLWATTTTSANIVNIYIGSAKGLQAYTQGGTPEGTLVCLSPEVLACPDPNYLHETLVHEFVHVLESHFAKELALKPDKNCTQYAVVIGRELPRMLKNLRRV